MIESELRNMKLNEETGDGKGNRYTRVPNGWVFTNFSGHICFIPESVNRFEDSVVKKDLTTESPVRKSRTTK